MPTTKPRVGIAASPRLRSFVLALVLGSAHGCERLSAVLEEDADEVEMTVTPSNIGLMLRFDLPSDADEPRYRIGGEQEAYPLVDGMITIPARSEPTTIEITWVDSKGRSHASTHTVDPRAKLTESAKRWLEQNPPAWVYLRQVSDTKLLYMTTLYTQRCGLAKVVYGVDTMTPDTEFALDACDVVNPTIIPYEAVTMVDLPANTQFVSVQLTYTDGTTSRVQRFDTFDPN
jgi:hypothetical protein